MARHMNDCVASNPAKEAKMWHQRWQVSQSELGSAKAENERLREVKAIHDGITDALEAAGYFHMSNAEGITAILHELEQLRASS
jgi:hypothetical protein